MSLLRVEVVSKSFGGLLALRDVSLEVEPGSIHGLMGANGAGKTTLFSIIAGNQRATSGRVLFEGRRIDGMTPDRVCRAGIARTFQIVRPFPGMSVRENVETAALFGRAETPSPAEAARIGAQVLRDIELSVDPDFPAAALTLSGRKRLEVARALATGPKLLLLDEVMAGLTPAEVTDMTAAIRRARESHGLTILIVEHVVDALTKLSDRITVLHHGQRIAEGTPSDVVSNPDVVAAYFGEEEA
jgi:branched-chain amino acid transport system ATP-binding protein